MNQPIVSSSMGNKIKICDSFSSIHSGEWRYRDPHINLYIDQSLVVSTPIHWVTALSDIISEYSREWNFSILISKTSIFMPDLRTLLLTHLQGSSFVSQVISFITTNAKYFDRQYRPVDHTFLLVGSMVDILFRSITLSSPKSFSVLSHHLVPPCSLSVGEEKGYWRKQALEKMRRILMGGKGCSISRCLSSISYSPVLEPKESIEESRIALEYVPGALRNLPNPDILSLAIEEVNPFSFAYFIIRHGTPGNLKSLPITNSGEHVKLLWVIILINHHRNTSLPPLYILKAVFLANIPQWNYFAEGNMDTILRCALKIISNHTGNEITMGEAWRDGDEWAYNYPRDTEKFHLKTILDRISDSLQMDPLSYIPNPCSVCGDFICGLSHPLCSDEQELLEVQ